MRCACCDTRLEESEVRYNKLLKRWDYCGVCKTVSKEILADLARRHFVHTSTFVPHDTHHSAFNEGRRSVILDIISLVNIPMEELDKLNRKAEDGRDSRTDNSGDWNSEF